MKTENLFIAIGSSDDKLIKRSEKRRKKKKKTSVLFKRLLPVAVAAVVVFIVAINGNLTQFIKTPSENIGEEETQVEDMTQEEYTWRDEQEGDGYSYDAPVGGWDGEETLDELEAKKQYGLDVNNEFYVCLQGPILPLTLEEEASYISAKRDIKFDFKNFGSFENEGSAVIVDTYALTNTSDKEQTIKVKYPYLASLEEMVKGMEMKAYADGTEVSVKRELSKYSGTDEQGNKGFIGASRIEDYKTMLCDETNNVDAIDLALLDKKVIVYEYKNYETNSAEGSCYAAQLRTEDTEDLYIANMNRYYTVLGETEYYGFIVEDMVATGRTPMLIFAGEEPEEYEACGYFGYEFSEDTVDDSVQAEMVRYESTFGEVLKKLVEEEIAIYEKENESLQIPEELYYKMASMMLADLVEKNANNETGGEWEIWENNISTIALWTYTTVFEQYLTCEITIPAGETVTYQIQYEKAGNFESTVPDDESLGNYGYDNMIHLNTNLNFETQSASIEDHGYINIVKQNYGFDLENNIKNVTLDRNTDYYYLVVKRKK